jgi:hypothetical protein
MKFAAERPYSDPEKAAARKLLEIANDVEVVQDGRIYIELINARPTDEAGNTPTWTDAVGRTAEKAMVSGFITKAEPQDDHRNEGRDDTVSQGRGLSANWSYWHGRKDRPPQGRKHQSQRPHEGR